MTTIELQHRDQHGNTKLTAQYLSVEEAIAATFAIVTNGEAYKVVAKYDSNQPAWKYRLGYRRIDFAPVFLSEHSAEIPDTYRGKPLRKPKLSYPTVRDSQLTKPCCTFCDPSIDTSDGPTPIYNELVAERDDAEDFEKIAKAWDEGEKSVSSSPAMVEDLAWDEDESDLVSA